MSDEQQVHWHLKGICWLMPCRFAHVAVPREMMLFEDYFHVHVLLTEYFYEVVFLYISTIEYELGVCNLSSNFDKR